jgi:CRISPR-associated protein (TIGR02584 family)
MVPDRSNSLLIATLGSKAQIITLTLDLLQRQGDLPGEVVVVHTWRDRFETAQALARLQADLPFAYPQVIYRSMELCDDSGPLRDVTAPQEVECAFRALYAEVRAAKLAERAVHMQIAGGRRTLTVFGMATAQMLFDERDRLWHLSSQPALEDSGRLHAGPDEWARLIPIPVVLWGRLSPVFEELSTVADPFDAAERLRQYRLREKWDTARTFVLGSLTGAEQRVAELLAREGLTDAEIAMRLSISPRTVERHLGDIYLKAAAHWDLPGVNRAQLITLLHLYYSTSGSNLLQM